MMFFKAFLNFVFVILYMLNVYVDVFLKLFFDRISRRYLNGNKLASLIIASLLVLDTHRVINRVTFLCTNLRRTYVSYISSDRRTYLIDVPPAYPQAGRMYVRYKLRSVSFLHPQLVPDKVLIMLHRSDVTPRNLDVVLALIVFPHRPVNRSMVSFNIDVRC